ncbi:hypothetical protein [Priestia megaterium]|uniref:hypothetical protein n=1 Tax=Priestia megaterium TaxID=1404 RepID=UPI001BE5C5F2|nr:hypothetical protein [Priestia megaterium]MBT2259226.1 hypothetical protein [Priestia megaterium]
MKQLVCIALIMGLFLPIAHSTYAYSDTNPVLSNFYKSYMTKGAKGAERYVAKGVTIPEVTEKTRIVRFQGLPAADKENTRIMIAYFENGKVDIDRIAFIWRVSFSKENVTSIEELYDGSEPNLKK